jgi:hypothetical protein
LRQLAHAVGVVDGLFGQQRQPAAANALTAAVPIIFILRSISREVSNDSFLASFRFLVNEAVLKPKLT